MTPIDQEEVARIAAGLTDGERTRLLLGRSDWREEDWEDHCGDYDCEQCNGYVDGSQPPLNERNDPEGSAVRAHLQGIDGGKAS